MGVNCYYDKDGKPISATKFTELKFTKQLLPDTDYVVVLKTRIVDHETVEVSTVWLGIDHAFGLGEQPLIFETMIFGGPYDQYQWRYATELEALAGHEAVVASLLAGDGPPTIDIPEDDEVEFE